MKNYKLAITFLLLYSIYSHGMGQLSPASPPTTTANSPNITIVKNRPFKHSGEKMRVHFGIIGGGPIPATIDPDSSSGKMALGPTIGFEYALFSQNPLKYRPKWELSLGMHYSLKGATYSQLIRQDTLYPIELIPGQIDTIPTFYYADIAGKMRLHYLELPVTFRYSFSKRLSAEAGIQLGVLFAGRDTGKVRIQIGEGGVFEDQISQYDNKAQINRLDWGINIGAEYVLIHRWRIPRLAIGFRVFRSFRTLYPRSFFYEQGLDYDPLYNTQFQLALRYRFGTGHDTRF